VANNPSRDKIPKGKRMSETSTGSEAEFDRLKAQKDKIIARETYQSELETLVARLDRFLLTLLLSYLIANSF
jgi:hypothetical protein